MCVRVCMNVYVCMQELMYGVGIQIEIVILQYRISDPFIVISCLFIRTFNTT